MYTSRLIPLWGVKLVEKRLVYRGPGAKLDATKIVVAGMGPFAPGLAGALLGHPDENLLR